MDNSSDGYLQRIQNAGLKLLVKSSAFKFTETFFPYTSGQIGPYYVNSESVTNGSSFREALDGMEDRISYEFSGRSSEIKNVSGGDSRDWVFSYPMADRLGVGHLTIYKDGKTFGPTIKDNSFVHVADLNNEGSSPKKVWIPTIRNAGGKVEHIFFYVDRLEDGVQVMKDLNLDSNSVVPLNSRAWDNLKKAGVVNEKVYGSLQERLEDKGAWARKMLRSVPGFAKYADMLVDARTTDKALKIIREGYPDMREELAERLLNVRLIKLSDYEVEKK